MVAGYLMMLRNFKFLLRYDNIWWGFFKSLSARDTHRNIDGWNNRMSVLCFKITQKRGNWMGVGMGQGQSGWMGDMKSLYFYFYVCSKVSIK